MTTKSVWEIKTFLFAQYHIVCRLSEYKPNDLPGYDDYRRMYAFPERNMYADNAICKVFGKTRNCKTYEEIIQTIEDLISFFSDRSQVDEDDHLSVPYIRDLLGIITTRYDYGSADVPVRFDRLVFCHARCFP